MRARTRPIQRRESATTGVGFESWRLLLSISFKTLTNTTYAGWTEGYVKGFGDAHICRPVRCCCAGAPSPSAQAASPSVRALNRIHWSSFGLQNSQASPMVAVLSHVGVGEQGPDVEGATTTSPVWHAHRRRLRRASQTWWQQFMRRSHHPSPRRRRYVLPRSRRQRARMLEPTARLLSPPHRRLRR